MNGIGGEVDMLAETYRGNPQALQQKQAVDPQLIYTLALQKIKTEMDAAQRDMQLQLNKGNPATVTEQLEQEVARGKQQEVMQQFGPTAQRKQAQQQQQIQQAPKQAAQAQQQAAQAQQGIGQLMQRQQPQAQQAPPQRMATGGVVQRFREGGSPESGQQTAESIERENKIKALMRQEGIGRKEAAQRVDRNAAGSGRASMLAPDIVKEGNLAHKATALLGTPATLAYDAVTGEGKTREMWDRAGLSEPREEKPQRMISGRQGTKPIYAEPKPTPQSSQAGGTGIPAVNPQPVSQSANNTGGINNIQTPYRPGQQPSQPKRDPSVATTTTTGGNQLSNINMAEQQEGLDKAIADLKGVELNPTDREQVATDTAGIFEGLNGAIPTKDDALASEQAAWDRSMERQGYDDRMKEHDAAYKKMEDMYSRQNDPERRRWDSIFAQMSAMGGHTTIGGGFAAAGRERGRQIQQLRSDEQNAADKLAVLSRDKNADRRSMHTAATNYATAAFNASMAERRTMLDARSSMVNTAISTASNENIAKYKSALDSAKAVVNAEADKMKANLKIVAEKAKMNVSERMADIEASRIISTLIADLRAAENSAKSAIFETENEDLKAVIRDLRSDDSEEREAAKATIAMLMTKVEDESSLRHLRTILNDLMERYGYDVGETPEDTSYFGNLGDSPSDAGAQYLGLGD